MTESKLGGNWEQYSQNQLAALARADVSAQAQALGLTAAGPGRAALTLWGRDYLIEQSGITAVDGGPVGSDHKSVMAHYLISKGLGEPLNTFVPMRRLTGMVESQMPSGDIRLRPLLEIFGEKYDLFIRSARGIGGVEGGLAPSGGHSWLFGSLPKVPMQVIFFEADDEFPAEIKVLFDQNAANFVSFECMELMEETLVEEISKAAQVG